MEKTNETMKETKGMMKETGEPIEETGEPVEETKEPIEETEETIKSFFEKNDWNYRYNEEDNVFSSGINMSNVLGNVKMYITLEKKCYTVYLVLNSKADEECRAVVGEFLHRANYGLKNGNFEMDYEDGEIRYKTFVNFKNTKVSEEIVEDSILVGAGMLNKYGKGLLKIMLGIGTPKECVEECEKKR